MKKIIVPVSEKFCLTIEEAAAYFGISEGRIRKLISSNPDAAYVLRNGRKTVIKRALFENYLKTIITIILIQVG